MLDDTDIRIAADWLRDARRVVIFSGAGVSAESGIDTFRDDGGLWIDFPPETFATVRGILRTALLRPRRCAEFLHRILEPIAQARPNPAHQALAALDRHVETIVVTQNIDGLHQQAGSPIVHEIHGSLLETCTLRGRFVKLLNRAGLMQVSGAMSCAARSLFPRLRMLWAMRPLVGLSRHGLVRPRVVLFGEALCEPAWTESLAAARTCDLMLVVGTSGVVLPAAMLPSEASANGARVIAIDPDDAGRCDLWLRGAAGAVLPLLLRRAFGETTEL